LKLSTYILISLQRFSNLYLAPILQVQNSILIKLEYMHIQDETPNSIIFSYS